MRTARDCDVMDLQKIFFLLYMYEYVFLYYMYMSNCTGTCIQTYSYTCTYAFTGRLIVERGKSVANGCNWSKILSTNRPCSAFKLHSRSKWYIPIYVYINLCISMRELHVPLWLNIYLYDICIDRRKCDCRVRSLFSTTQFRFQSITLTESKETRNIWMCAYEPCMFIIIWNTIYKQTIDVSLKKW